jgi:hypothetical protein
VFTDGEGNEKVEEANANHKRSAQKRCAKTREKGDFDEASYTHVLGPRFPGFVGCSFCFRVLTFYEYASLNCP